MSRWSDYVKARRRSASLKGTLASAGLYELGTDEPGELRFNAGGRERNVFDLLMNKPAISPKSRIVYIPFDNDYAVNTTSVWDESNSGSGTGLTIQDAIGNKAKFTNGGSDNNYYYYEYKYEKGKLQSGKDLWFYTSIEIADADEADMFVGLCADLASGNLFDNRVDAVGITLADGDATLNGVCTKNGTGSPSTMSVDVSDGTEIYVGFHSYGVTHVDFFAGVVGSDAHRLRITSNLPDDEELAPAFGLRNGTGSANAMTISDIWLLMDR